MVLVSDAFRYQINNSGRTLRVRYFTETIGSVWDDDRTLVASGNSLYVSGLVLGIDQTRGSEDQVLLEEGRISFDDSKFFVAGSLDTTSGIRVFTIAISGADRVYREITPGVMQPQFLGDDVYKKVYGRLLVEGSLF